MSSDETSSCFGSRTVIRVPRRCIASRTRDQYTTTKDDEMRRYHVNLKDVQMCQWLRFYKPGDRIDASPRASADNHNIGAEFSSMFHPQFPQQSPSGQRNVHYLLLGLHHFVQSAPRASPKDLAPCLACADARLPYEYEKCLKNLPDAVALRILRTTLAEWITFLLGGRLC